MCMITIQNHCTPKNNDQNVRSLKPFMHIDCLIIAINHANGSMVTS
jgi:hypothetical protein